MIIIPKIEPTLKQYEVDLKLQDKITKNVFFGGGAGGGKTWEICQWLITQCLIYPNTKWFIGRNELKRLMGSTYLTFRKVQSKLGIPESYFKLNGQYNYIECENGSRIDLIDVKYLPSDPMYERFGSTEYTGGAGEEVGEWHFLAFDVLKSRIGRHLNQELNIMPKFLLTCNPTKNWVYRVAYKPWKNGTLPKDYAFIQSLYKDNPYTADSYGEQLRGIQDKTMRERLMNGNWDYDDTDNSLVTYDAILDLFTNTISKSYEKYLTCDAARFGGDRIPISCWEGLNLYKLKLKSLQSTDVTALDIKSTASEEQIPYSQSIIDEDGVGGGVLDQCRGMKGFVNNSSPIEVNDPSGVITDKLIKQNFTNLKSQCAFMLADKINKHEICITAEIDEVTKDLIITELQQLRKRVTNDDTKLSLITKDEMKENIGHSPDLLDSMIMRMYFELKPRTVFINNPVGGYDLLDI